MLVGHGQIDLGDEAQLGQDGPQGGETAATRGTGATTTSDVGRVTGAIVDGSPYPTIGDRPAVTDVHGAAQLAAGRRRAPGDDLTTIGTPPAARARAVLSDTRRVEGKRCPTPITSHVTPPWATSMRTQLT